MAVLMPTHTWDSIPHSFGGRKSPRRWKDSEKLLAKITMTNTLPGVFLSLAILAASMVIELTYTLYCNVPGQCFGLWVQWVPFLLGMMVAIKGPERHATGSISRWSWCTKQTHFMSFSSLLFEAFMFSLSYMFRRLFWDRFKWHFLFTVSYWCMGTHWWGNVACIPHELFCVAVALTWVPIYTLLSMELQKS